MNRARLLLALTTLLAALLPAAGAAASPPPAQTNYSHMGLGHFTPVPGWAKNLHIHFLPTHANATRPGSFEPTGAGKALGKGAQGAIGELGVREGEEGPLYYYNHGGYGVQHTVKIYPIFWGSNWNKEPGLAVKAALMKMYEGFSGSNYQGILNQYFDHTSRVSKTVEVSAPYVDTSVTAPSGVDRTKVEEEVAAAIKANGWTREARAQFTVILAPGSTYPTAEWCAYHQRDNSYKSSFSLIPYMGDEPFAAGCLGYDEKEVIGHVEQMVASHEYAEAATDPVPSSETEDTSTWVNRYGSEIGDICASGDDELPNGTWAQGEWDNYLNACALSDPAPAEAYGVTGLPSEVESHAVTFTGSVYPQGHESEYWFEYGLSPEFGNSTSPVKVSAGEFTDSSQEASAKASGLELNRTYFYRLVVKNSTGTVKGGTRRVGTSDWLQQPMVEFPTDRWPWMRDVSCVSSSFCMAVGERSIPYNIGAIPKNLAERWNGSEWIDTEAPWEISSRLEGVSCVSTSFCMAVGNSNYAVYWNGAKWTAAVPAVPASGEEIQFSSVSCVSSNWCVAVGNYSVESEDLPLVETWNGSSWSVQPSPMAAVYWLEMGGVSCSSQTQCMAVGWMQETYEKTGEAPVKPVALSLEGTLWTHLTGVPIGAKYRNNYYNAVSCPTSNFCMVAAESHERPGEELYEQYGAVYESKSWQAVSTIASAGTNDVSCIAANWCEGVGAWQVGASQGEPAIAHWNGEKWIAEEPFLPTSGEYPAGFDGASCPEVSSCEAVGFYSYNVPAGGGYQGQFTKTLAEARAYAWPTASSSLGTVTASSAEVTGTVNPASSATTYQVEYGTTSAYGSKTAAESAGSGTSGVAVSPKVTGLTPNTTYHYRLVATNGVGTTLTRDATFTTGVSAGLCKANESPCVAANRYANATKVSASLKSATSLTLKNSSGETINSCTGSSLEGKVTGAGGPGEATTADVSTASFTGCTNTLSAEGLSWHSTIARTEGGSGTETFSNLSLKTIVAGISCTYGASVPFSLTGGAEAQLAVSEASLPKTSGGILCPSTVKLSATYLLKSPAPLYITPYPLGATVLCKTSSEVCAEANRYASATKVTASLKSATTLTLKESGGKTLDSCTGSSLEGKVSGAGGETEVPTADVSTATFTGCSSGAVASEGLSWHSEIRPTTATNGTETFSNLALSAVLSGTTCKYGGQVAFGLTGASQAELAVSEASLAKTSGSFLCPSSVKLTATYLITAPAPLYVSRPK